LDAFVVDFGNLEGAVGGDEIFGEYTHAGANLDDGYVGDDIDGLGDTLGYTFVGQEMLSEGFFGSNLFHNVDIFRVGDWLQS
jgi:hypothetical protein